ncbi:head-tail connector protein [Marimonas arenosa]|uniref:Head-tail connector protein n=1 Tax=Marimonas arenosa TaxID=1795305 RepID=A0AAE3WAH0_9RHOB|nr:head-tail connector protein [Marimonas arenosa]MDQ2089142.1 head-tail connector protein [Marimonas arenosa]
MMLIEETPIPLSALPVAEFKAHLRLGSGFAEDSLQDSVLESFLRAAIAAIEARTGKILIAREFSWTLTAWRDQLGQALPVAPVSAILDLVLIDAAEGEEIVDPVLYRLVQDMQRPRIAPTGTLLPTVPSGGAVRVRFAAGFGAGWSDLPSDLGQAVLLLAAHYYEYRNETGLGDGCMPFGVTSLIERYRTVRLFGGAGR